jgi:hypothetical protein
MFTKSVGGIQRPRVSKGTKATVTKSGCWWSDAEVTLRSGTSLTVRTDEVSKIGRKRWWEWWFE